MGWFWAGWQYWKKNLGKLWATFEVGFFMFSGPKNSKTQRNYKNIVASALESYIKWSWNATYVIIMTLHDTVFNIKYINSNMWIFCSFSGKYLLFTMILVSFSVVMTIGVLNVNFRTPATHKVIFVWLVSCTISKIKFKNEPIMKRNPWKKIENILFVF